MPRLPIAMFAIKEILRLHHDAGHTQREISRATGVSQSAIQRLLRRASQAGLGWPLTQPAASDAELYAQLYPAPAGPREALPARLCAHAQSVELRLLWSRKPLGRAFERSPAHPSGSSVDSLFISAKIGGFLRLNRRQNAWKSEYCDHKRAGQTGITLLDCYRIHRFSVLSLPAVAD